MRFLSKNHPQLVVRDLGVRFVNGEAEVADPAAIESLRAMPAEVGVRAAPGRRPSTSDPEPKRKRE